MKDSESFQVNVFLMIICLQFVNCKCKAVPYFHTDAEISKGIYGRHARMSSYKQNRGESKNEEQSSHVIKEHPYKDG